MSGIPSPFTSSTARSAAPDTPSGTVRKTPWRRFSLRTRSPFASIVTRSGSPSRSTSETTTFFDVNLASPVFAVTSVNVPSRLLRRS